jgi:hypothetical protein
MLRTIMDIICNHQERHALSDGTVHPDGYPNMDLFKYFLNPVTARYIAADLVESLLAAAEHRNNRETLILHHTPSEITHGTVHPSGVRGYSGKLDYNAIYTIIKRAIEHFDLQGLLENGIHEITQLGCHRTVPMLRGKEQPPHPKDLLMELEALSREFSKNSEFDVRG